jgi:hypothetical protein
MVCQNPWFSREGVSRFEDVTRADVFEQQQQRAATIDDKTFKGFLTLQHAKLVQIGMLEHLVPPADPNPMQTEVLRSRFKLHAPLGFMLHRFHGFQADGALKAHLPLLGVHLPAEKEVGYWRSRFGFDTFRKRARNNPCWQWSGSKALTSSKRPLRRRWLEIG